MRRIPLSRRSHIIGFQTVPGSASVAHESALERDFVTLARFTDPAAEIISQPVTIAFRHDAAWRRYTPDYLVHWSRRPSEFIEIKYRRDLRLHWTQLRPAFVAARLWAQRHQARFRIVTESAIRRPELQNAKRLLPLRAAPLNASLADQVRAALHSLPDPTFENVAASVSGERASAVGTLWRMLARGELRADLSEPLGRQTRLGLP